MPLVFTSDMLEFARQAEERLAKDFSRAQIARNEQIEKAGAEEGRALYAPLQRELNEKYIPSEEDEIREAYLLRLYYLARVFNLAQIKTFLIESYATHQLKFLEIEAQPHIPLEVDGYDYDKSKRPEGEKVILTQIEMYLLNLEKRDPVKRAVLKHLFLAAIWCPQATLDVIAGWLENENSSQWSQITREGRGFGLFGSNEVAEILNACAKRPAIVAAQAAAARRG